MKIQLYSQAHACAVLEADPRDFRRAAKFLCIEPLMMGVERAYTAEQVNAIGIGIAEVRREKALQRDGIHVGCVLSAAHLADIRHAAMVHGVPQGRLTGALAAWAIKNGPGISEIAKSIGGRDVSKPKRGRPRTKKRAR